MKRPLCVLLPLLFCLMGLCAQADVAALDAAALTNVAVGFVCAFVAGIFVVRWLLNYVSAHGYGLFAWWRIAVGTLALAGLWLVG